jgi:hypothetical protein
MFVIRQRHTEALQAARHDDFRRRTARSLRARFEPAQHASPEALDAFIDDGVADGARYGLYGEGDILTLLEYRMVCGDAFPQGEEDAWARAILEDPRLDVDEKLRRLDTQFANLALSHQPEEGAAP